MTNEKLLRKRIDEYGYKLRFVAKKLDITYQGLLNKITNLSEFKAGEIQILCDLLHINLEEKEKIFFMREVDRMTTDAKGEN